MAVRWFGRYCYARAGAREWSAETQRGASRLEIPRGGKGRGLGLAEMRTCHELDNEM